MRSTDMAVAHAELKPLLRDIPGRRFIETLMLVQQPWSSERHTPKGYFYDVFEEMPLISESSHSMRNPQADAMICLHFWNGDIHYKDAVHILVEIKGTIDDLKQSCRNPEYFDKYMGRSEYFYLAVTTDLVDQALQLVLSPEVGVFDIEKGVIHKLAGRQDISKEIRIQNFYVESSYYDRKKLHPRVFSHLPCSLLSLPEPKFSIHKEDSNERTQIYQKCHTFRNSFVAQTDGLSETKRMSILNICLGTENKEEPLLAG